MKLEFESNSTLESSFVANEYAAETASASEKDVALMLQAGVKAAQEGNRREARVLLLQVAEAAPDNENVWLWLASISDYPEELLVSLNNVLKINPHNARALEWAYATKSLLAKNFVQRGVDASNEVQMDLAKQYFLQAVVYDDHNEMAWFWLASISDSADEKLAHLHKVLSINPENETALNALQIAKSQITESLLRKANTAAVAGEREAANEMVHAILKQTPESEEAWILKSYLADSFSDKVVCFEKVLLINPENEAAVSGLASLREMMAQTENKKSPNLAVVTAFLATPAESEHLATEFPALAEVEDNASEFGADEQFNDNSLEFGAVVEEAESYSEDISESQPATKTEYAFVAPQPRYSPNEDKAEVSNYRKESLESFQETEAVNESEYFQTADFTSESQDAPTEMPEAEEIYKESAQPIHSDYPAPEVYVAPPDVHLDLDFDAAPTPEYSSNTESSNVETAEPIRQEKPALKKIMIVDDSATVRKLIAQKLEMSGYEVICSADGIEALKTIQKNVPDLILLDTVLPQMDGYQVCQSIRGNELTRNVPIVMISGKDGFFDKVRGQMSGSTGYIAKPFGPETLIKTVESYIA